MTCALVPPTPNELTAARRTRPGADGHGRSFVIDEEGTPHMLY